MNDPHVEMLKGVHEIVAESYKNPRRTPSNTARDATTALGLVSYDLQAPAKMIVPVMTPFRTTVPRVRISPWRRRWAIFKAKVQATIDLWVE